MARPSLNPRVSYPKHHAEPITWTSLTTRASDLSWMNRETVNRSLNSPPPPWLALRGALQQQDSEEHHLAAVERFGAPIKMTPTAAARAMENAAPAAQLPSVIVAQQVTPTPPCTPASGGYQRLRALLAKRQVAMIVAGAGLLLLSTTAAVGMYALLAPTSDTEVPSQLPITERSNNPKIRSLPIADDERPSHRAPVRANGAATGKMGSQPVTDRQGSDRSPQISDDRPGNSGALLISSEPNARIFVDGQDTGRSTPVRPGSALRLRPGKRRITLVVGKRQFNYFVQIQAGRTEALTRILPHEE